MVFIMECPVCLSEKPCTTLVCKHAFCKDCLKNWLSSPTQLEKPTCPMCRASLLFKGIGKIQWILEEKRWDAAYDEVYGELVTETINGYQTYCAIFGEILHSRSIMKILKRVEETFKVLKDIDGEHPNTIWDFIAEGDGMLRYKKEYNRLRRYAWSLRDKQREAFTQASPRLLRSRRAGLR